ncbi:hypothetical protein DL764_002881 [Monosporascus ibericus]|uniref:Alpha/beta hydrolase fold-3 domain-containing protein n=1 Tax=Monosporascus ibericus TaxID=155417 RepID=A0A4Q4TJZ1_9PEZI|nr:hypothetical protein DL764_002881 [Monosporascus ibericus]
MADYDSREAVQQLGQVNPEFAEYLKTHDPDPLATTPFPALVEMSRHNPIPLPPTSESEFTRDIPLRDGYLSNIRVHKPQTPSRRTVVLIHGGGFCTGHNTQVSVYARAIASLYGATVINVSYRFAPEFKFPTAPNDVWDTLQWLTTSKDALTLGLDFSSGFIIGGVSAGANLTAVTVQRWVSEKLTPPISGVWLSIPYLLEAETVPDQHMDIWISREQNAHAMVIDEATMDFVKTAYAPDIKSPAFSPFNARGAHKGLPPVYIQVCGQDPVRDDGLIYEKVLRGCGVSTKLDVYPGVPHGFMFLFPTLEISERCNLDTMKGIGWLFGEEKESREFQEAYAVSGSLQTAST